MTLGVSIEEDVVAGPVLSVGQRSPAGQPVTPHLEPDSRDSARCGMNNPG